MTLTFDLDLAVVGGGPSGIAAAVAGARSGLSTAIFEWHGYLGGSRTAAAVDTFYGFWTPGDEARPVVGGVGLEIIEGCLNDGGFRRENTYGAGPGVTYDVEALKIQLDQLILDAGVQPFYHSVLSKVARRDDGGWDLTFVTATAGEWTGVATTIIDTTGDASAARLAGFEVVDAFETGTVQSLTTIFFIGGVDTEVAMSVSHQDRSAMIAEADLSGDYRLPRHEGSLHRTPHPGVLQANIVRLPNVDATNPKSLTFAEIEGRRQAMEYFRFFQDRMPGFENAYLSGLGHQIGIRETRRIVGATTLTENDVLTGVRDDNGIALCAAPIEDHHAGSDTQWSPVGGDGLYSIPFRSLVPAEGDGLLAAGRCLSAEHAAQASARNSAQAFATGEAAGYTASLAQRDRIALRDVSVEELRAMIAKNGGLL